MGSWKMVLPVTAVAVFGAAGSVSAQDDLSDVAIADLALVEEDVSGQASSPASEADDSIRGASAFRRLCFNYRSGYDSCRPSYYGGYTGRPGSSAYPGYGGYDGDYYGGGYADRPTGYLGIVSKTIAPNESSLPSPSVELED